MIIPTVICLALERGAKSPLAIQNQRHLSLPSTEAGCQEPGRDNAASLLPGLLCAGLVVVFLSGDSGSTYFVQTPGPPPSPVLTLHYIELW